MSWRTRHLPVMRKVCAEKRIIMADRALAHIEVINSITPIKGKDRIVLATVLGWTVIIQKDAYKVGDKVVFCEIDSV